MIREEQLTTLAKAPEHLDLRASSMPLAFLCPGAIRIPDVRIHESGEAADVGTETHAALARIVCGQEPPEASSDEVRILTAIGRKMWRKVEASFPNPSCEREFSAVFGQHTLTGHVDILSIVDRSAIVGDWKTGRKDTDYSHQMRAYCVLALLSDETLLSADAMLLWVREQEFERYSMTREQADAWVCQLRDRVIEWDGIYHPGTHCQWCPRYDCAARGALERQAIASFLDGDGPILELANMPPEQIASLYDRQAMLANMCHRVHEAIRAHVSAQGPVKANGKILDMIPEHRRQIDPVKAIDVLNDLGWQPEDFALCLSVSASKADKVAASKAAPRKGAAAVRELQAALEAAGAVSTIEIKKLSMKRG